MPNWRVLLTVAVLQLSGLGAAAAVALPPTVEVSGGELRRLGSGEMRWFGLKIYDASLWVPSGLPWSADTAFALAIRYARSVPADRLVDSSIDEMRRLGFGDERSRSEWRVELARALPSVAAGEVLVGARVPGAGARFWHEGRLTAEIADPELARAFFAIWLDSRTREPGLRARLLGEGGEGQ